MKVISLNKKNPVCKLKVNREQPFIGISQLRISGFTPQLENIASILVDLDLHVKLIIDDEVKNSRPLGLGAFLGSNIEKPLMNWYKYEEILNMNSFHDTVELELEDYVDFNLTIEFELNYFKEKISLNNPWEEFRIHISEEDNTNILFSAPFGQGKTSFLNEYFRQNHNNYEVFKIYPVNYSVASNEDIFKYIKSEIFYQILLNEKFNFDKNDISHFKEAPKYIYKNAKYILGPFLKDLPLIGRSILDVYDRIEELGKKYFEEVKINEKDKIEKFISEIYEKEGNLYEANYFTILIRVLLTKYSKKWNKQMVLVIDDLDRMDPEHIFRILNVLSAHFDSPSYGPVSGLSNKFGFHKIIIVGDYQNLSKIFGHKFGSLTDFAGYINKYFSKTPFIYNNKKAISSIIDELETVHKSRSMVIKVSTFILRDLLFTDELSLRDILKWKASLQINFMSTEHRNKRIFFRENLITMKNDLDNSKLVLFNVIYLLLKIWDIEILIKKIDSCKNKCESNDTKRAKFDFFAIGGAALLVLSNQKRIREKVNYPIRFRDKNMNLNVKLSEDDIGYRYFECTSLLAGEPGMVPEEFINLIDFYDIFIINALNYRKMGGLDDF